MNERSAEFLALKRDFYGGSVSPNINSKEEAHRAELEFYQYAQNQGKTFTNVVNSAGGSIIPYRFNIVLGDGSNETFTNEQLANGVDIYTPTIGDIILNILVRVKSGFTEPGNADIGTFIGSDTQGLFKNWANGEIFLPDATLSDSGTTGLALQSFSYDFDSATGEGGLAKSNIIYIIDDYPIKFLLTENGQKGGNQVNNTDGEVEIILLILKNNSIIDLN